MGGVDVSGERLIQFTASQVEVHLLITEPVRKHSWRLLRDRPHSPAAHPARTQWDQQAWYSENVVAIMWIWDDFITKPVIISMICLWICNWSKSWFKRFFLNFQTLWLVCISLNQSHLLWVAISPGCSVSILAKWCLKGAWNICTNPGQKKNKQEGLPCSAIDIFPTTSLRAGCSLRACCFM